MRRRTAWLLLLALLAAPGTARAVIPPPQILGIRVGFGGYYKVGLWTPVEIQYTEPAEQSIILPDGDGVPSRVSTAGGGSKLLYGRFGRVNSRMTVELDDEVSPVAADFESDSQAGAAGFGTAYRPAVAANRAMIVTVAADSDGGHGVAGDPLGVQDAVKSLHQRQGRETVVVRLADCRQLPDRWYGYEAVDTLVLSTSGAEIFADLRPDCAKLVALETWIQMGGKLVLCVGREAEAVIGQGGPLAGFAPGKLAGMSPLGQAEAGHLETYAGSANAIPRPAGNQQQARCVPRLAAAQGTIEAGRRNLPLVVRTPRGLGQITFLAADLDRPPLSRWADRPMLVARLLDLPSGGSERPEEGSALMHYGFNDMAGQLRSALDQFSGVQLVPFWVVAVLIVAYILLIGPVDYFFLRKVVGRMRWTWLTFPLVVLAVSLAAYWLANYFKCSQVRVNQVDLVDVDGVSGRLRGTTWANVFSPKSRTFNLSLRPELYAQGTAERPQVLFAWLGLPGRFLGGMDPRASNPLLQTQPYDFSPDLSSMEGVPIQVWSTKSFTARWAAHTDAYPQARLIDEGQYLSGSIENTLRFPLSKCILAYRRYAYQLDDLQPGESWGLDSSSRRCELRTLLTERRIVASARGGTYQQVATPYDQGSVDPWYILRVMMFYAEAGGERYTGLSNGYQSFVDLSGLLSTDRAILVAQGPADQRAATLLDDGQPMTDPQDRHLTVYRFVLPVQEAGGE